MMQQQHHEADGTGYQIVDTSVSCLLTRFRLRSMWSLLGFYLSYKRVRAETAECEGLIASLFLVENLRTCYTLSFWRNVAAIVDFNGRGRAHVNATNRSFQHLEMGATGPELC